MMDSNEDEDKRRGRRRIDSRIWPKGDYTKEKERTQTKKEKKNIQLNVRVKQGKRWKGERGRATQQFDTERERTERQIRL